MKPNKQILSALLVPTAVLAIVLMSFSVGSHGEIWHETNTEVNPDAKDQCCCPPGWTVVGLFPGDPATPWDNNGDGFICSKGAWLGDETPKGKGNDPLFDQSNVKDNNNPCAADDFGPCSF